MSKVWHYRIQVWNNEGEIVHSQWDCDEATMRDIEDEYGERSNYEIIYQNRWQTDEPFEFATSAPPPASSIRDGKTMTPTTLIIDPNGLWNVERAEFCNALELVTAHDASNSGAREPSEAELSTTLKAWAELERLGVKRKEAGK